MCNCRVFWGLLLYTAFSVSVCSVLVGLVFAPFIPTEIDSKLIVPSVIVGALVALLLTVMNWETGMTLEGFVDRFFKGIKESMLDAFFG